MLKYRNILVYIDPTQEQQPALQRALKLQKRTKCKNHFVPMLLRFDLRNDLFKFNGRTSINAIASHTR